MGGPLLNVLLRAYSTKLAFKFSPLKKCLFYVFVVFVDSRVRGRPLINMFLRAYWTKFAFLICALQNSARSMFFAVFLDSREGPR